jgi:hypothetical protein
MIETINVIEDSNAAPLRNAGAPSAGTDEVWTLTIGGTPTGGTFKLKFGPFVSGDITWSSTNATLLANIQAALDAMPNIGANGFIAAAGTLTAGIGTITLTAGGNLTKLAVLDSFSVHTNALTGSAPTLAVVETTPGVTATFRGAQRGRKMADVTNGIDYIQSGANPLAPTWTKVGTQT